MRNIFGLILAAAGACNAQTSPAKVVFEPAPIGVATTGNTVLFSQPFSTGQGVPRGVYAVGAATPLVPLPPSADAENYFVVSPGLGGFAAGSIYAYGLLNGSPTIFRAGSGGGAPSTFISNVPVGQTAEAHVFVTFDAVGSFGFNLIATGANGVQGYSSSAAPTFFYPSPNPGNFLLESATVAPQTFSACPGCRFLTAEPKVGTSGAIYVIPAGSPSGTVPTFWASGPQFPEGIVFVPANPCSVGGYSYFVSAFSHPGIADVPVSPGGAILEYTAAQLAPYAGKYLVPDEATGIIYAYTDSSATPDATPFSSTGDQLEGSTLSACPVTVGSSTGFMTGGGQMSAFSASHGFNLGCDVGSNHNNLEVNWAGGNKFHLESISSVTCFLDPALPNPAPPAANFNTLVLTGTGKYNNQPGASVNLIFTDAGEPGVNDLAEMVVTFNGSTVLNIPLAKIATGNQQAHK